MTALKNYALKIKRWVGMRSDCNALEYLRFFSFKNHNYLLAKRKEKVLYFETKNGFDFNPVTKFPSLVTSEYTLPNIIWLDNFRYKNNLVGYYGDRFISVAWLKKNKVIKPRTPIIYTSLPVEPCGAFVSSQCLILVYLEKVLENKITNFSLKLALLSKKDPKKLLWSTPLPIMQTKKLWPSLLVKPLGSLMIDQKIISYWEVGQKIIFGVALTGFCYDPHKLKPAKLPINKYSQNPIITPNPQNSWEALYTFNPAAAVINNKVHIFYRSQGWDYISSVGYAISQNGYNIDKRFDKPVFTSPLKNLASKPAEINWNYVSGGGFGGCEDPRVTVLGNKLYMVYVAFDGVSPPRLALTSILLNDLLNKRWHWTKPVLISPPGIVDKSGCLLPAKINGQYVFFHRVFPNILIDYVDDLKFDGQTKWLKGKFQIKIRPHMWDSRKIGAGAPPVKTKDGWLMIYYGVDNKDPSKYKIGAMLLDLIKPHKVLYRSNEPIIVPEQSYEQTGFKPGIVYPCGVVIKNNNLLVYYGGADSVVCVATANLNEFLSKFKSQQPLTLKPALIKEVNFV